MSQNIPETLNSLPMADAFRFYRDVLKWHVYPSYGPLAKVVSPGKQPAVKKWWEYDPYDCPIAKFFESNGHCHNIGFGPRCGSQVRNGPSY